MRADDVGNDDQIAIRLKSHGQRPEHLGFIEYINIVIDDDHMLNVRIGDKRAERRLFRLAFGPFLDSAW